MKNTLLAAFGIASITALGITAIFSLPSVADENVNQPPQEENTNPLSNEPPQGENTNPLSNEPQGDGTNQTSNDPQEDSATQSAQVKKATFFCGTSDGVPVTFAKTPKGDVPVIRWVSTFFDPTKYSPQRRCEMVTAKFQTYQEQGTLNYLTTGRENNQNVVCVSTKENGPCSGTLFTLKAGEEPGAALQNLLAVRAGAAGPVNESTRRIYISMKQILNRKSVALRHSSRRTPGVAPRKPSAPSSKPQGNLW